MQGPNRIELQVRKMHANDIERRGRRNGTLLEFGESKTRLLNLIYALLRNSGALSLHKVFVIKTCSNVQRKGQLI